MSSHAIVEIQPKYLLTRSVVNLFPRQSKFEIGKLKIREIGNNYVMASITPNHFNSVCFTFFFFYVLQLCIGFDLTKMRSVSVPGMTRMENSLFRPMELFSG